MDEIWKSLPEMMPKFCEVSNLGRVRTHDRDYAVNGGFRDIKGKILSIQYDKKGMRTPRVLVSHDGKRKNLLLSRVVAAAFVGDITDKYVTHIDGNVRNNRWDNLEIVDPKVVNSRGHLSRSCVNEIRSVPELNDAKKHELAKKFKITIDTVDRIYRGETRNFKGNADEA